MDSSNFDAPCLLSSAARTWARTRSVQHVHIHPPPRRGRLPSRSFPDGWWRWARNSTI